MKVRIATAAEKENPAPFRPTAGEVDAIQVSIMEFAQSVRYARLPQQVIAATKVRTINVLAALFAGFFSEPAAVLRKVANQTPCSSGATVLGTRIKTTPDMAAYANTTTAAYMEMSDTYHVPGTYHGHPSDVIMPLIAAAEHVRADGKAFIAAVVVAYQVYLRLSDNFANQGFDYTNFQCIGTAAGAGRLFELSETAMSQCISMAAVPNVILRQVRHGQLSMYRAGASGHAGRSGIFAATLARAGMEGPHLPFLGKAGWCDHVARNRFSLDPMCEDVSSYRILDTRIKNRISCGEAIASILAAEKIAPIRNASDISQIRVEVCQYAKVRAGDGEHRMNPQSRETADHSIPYVVAATLIDGSITPRSYGESRLWNRDLRALMKKVIVVENAEFTQAFEHVPVRHLSRVTVQFEDGSALIGEAGGDGDDLADPFGEEAVMQRFRDVAEDTLGRRRVERIIGQLCHLEETSDMAEIVTALAIE